MSNLKHAMDEARRLAQVWQANRIRWVMVMMNSAIAMGRIGCICGDLHIVETCMVHAKKAYGAALTRGGKRPFQAQECGDFEWKSEQVEELIREMKSKLTKSQPAKSKA